MAKNTHFLKKFFRRVAEEGKPIVASALKSGATNVGNELLNVTRDASQQSSLNLGKIIGAVKSGIMTAGEEMMSKGMDRLRGDSSQEDTSESSEVSTTNKGKKQKEEGD